MAEDASEKRKEALTKRERAIYNTLSCPIDMLRFPYEPNPLEHLPSRMMNLAPHPFGQLISLCLSAFAESLATEKPPPITPSPQPASAEHPPAPKTHSLTDQIQQSFQDAQNLNPQSVAQCCKATRKKVKAIYELLPDDYLGNNTYSVASVPEGVHTELGSFILASEQSAQSCLYESVTTNLPDGVTLGPHDTYGVPFAMFNYQHSSSQAPKRWLVMRRPRDSNVGYVTEMDGRRIALTLDREFSVESNSSIYLKVENGKKRRLE
eukprot:Protomagalhaensia_wolfi_Nauph_80__2376@NODE_2561_length_1053_cov_11_139053_g2003_i0_p1_GENE_NODE_2561_length_1053_cov_11_139053_g2003_i0NODE_2561_length_1053_cov_11_139053_g2003_i0_p1_ORF_typecomplete_len265_score28_20SRA1/PF07304_11/0_049Paf1/PF03985_13/0_079GIT1_C/PF12205_8/0_13_NODE_2561_length_1053_cov_11_139053_g2003_i0129923